MRTLNGIEVGGSFTDGDATCYVLECGIAQATALDGQALTLSDGTTDTDAGTCRVTLAERVSGTETRLWSVPDATAHDREQELQGRVDSLTAELSERDASLATATSQLKEATDRLADTDALVTRLKERLSKLGITLDTDE